MLQFVFLHCIHTWKDQAWRSSFVDQLYLLHGVQNSDADLVLGVDSPEVVVPQNHHHRHHL